MHLLVTFGVLVLASFTSARMANLTKKDNGSPNIVWLFADDYGFNDVGFRNDIVHSPNIDELATSGIIFTNAYTAPQCSPSRGAFLSGRYPFRTGMQHGVIMDTTPNCMPLEFKLLPLYMKDLGYDTHAFGKWHLGYCREECTPLGRGFDTFNGGFSGEGEYYNHTTFGAHFYDWHVGNDPDPSAAGIHSQDLIQQYVLATLDANDGTPFFMYVAFHNTHSPLDPKEEFLSLYNDLDAPEPRKKYLGLVSGMDYVIGEIVTKLKDLGLYNNTYILFSSDNGGDVDEADNSPRRGGKSSLWEGGVHANTWAHSPLLEASGVENDGLFHITDWLPTIVSLAGGSVPESDGLDGFDQTDMVARNGESKRTNLFYNIDREEQLGPPAFGAMAVRNDRYKLMWGFEGRNDGYGTDLDFIYHQQYVKDEVDEYYAALTGTDRKKRGGPYVLTPEETHYLNGWMALTHVGADAFEDGTGHMHLFDLLEDPNETTDLIDSEDPEHQAAKDELVQMIQDAVHADSYYKMELSYTKASKSFQAPDQTLTTGWCEAEFP